MAKEFDIYLRKNLVECDLLVYSISYHDGISVANRLILETALNGYILQKFAAVQMGSELTAHIDDMIKLCLEKLRMDTSLGASAEFEAQSKLYLEGAPLIIDSPAVEAIARMMNEAESGMVLAVDPLVTQVSSSTGRCVLPIMVHTRVTDTLKHSLLTLRSTLVQNAEVAQINQIDYIGADAPVVMDSTISSLCYQLSAGASAAVEIVALLLGTDIHHSLGVWYSGMTASAKVAGTCTQKFVAAQAVTSIVQEAAGKLTKILYPYDNVIVVGAQSLNVHMKRYRLLYELDGLALADIDNMSLKELDYVQFT